MSIGGISGGLSGLYGPGPLRDTDRPERTAPEGGVPVPARAPDPRGLPPETHAAPDSTASPGGPPADVDPALWSVLTTEEREFFLKARDLGPITYRPGPSGRDAAPQRGGRVDVRV